MDDIVFAGNRALYLILVMSAGPIAVATFVGLLVGLFQTCSCPLISRQGLYLKLTLPADVDILA
ncbi:flagellar biosynthetic protein FliQ, partial [Escherichia coli]|uniref:flagellar biosynthetic protein FliQ n=1 Tax=Escherichia coli TaxID=562 RepID=UPI001FCE7CDE